MGQRRRMTAHNALRYGLGNEVVALERLDVATQAGRLRSGYPDEELRKRSSDARDGPPAQ